MVEIQICTEIVYGTIFKISELIKSRKIGMNRFYFIDTRGVPSLWNFGSNQAQAFFKFDFQA